MILIVICLLLWMSFVKCGIDITPYRQLLLDMHNDCRRELTASNMQKLAWSSNLEQEATAWADNCRFEHQQKGHGENIAVYTSRLGIEDLLRKGFKMWNKEQEEFIYGEKLSMKTGRYTQLIWANTEEVGCGMTKCSVLFMKNGVTVRDGWLFVCFYNPAGNIIGKDPYIKGNSCKKCRESQQCDNGLCQENKISAVKEQKTNNKTCEDSATWCALWTELCTDSHHRSKMYNHCRKTCDLCQYKVCEDKRPTGICKYWKYHVYCTQPEYETFMNNNCAKTCNTCQKNG